MKGFREQQIHKGPHRNKQTSGCHSGWKDWIRIFSISVTVFPAIFAPPRRNTFWSGAGDPDQNFFHSGHLSCMMPQWSSRTRQTSFDGSDTGWKLSYKIINGEKSFAVWRSIAGNPEISSFVALHPAESRKQWLNNSIHWPTTNCISSSTLHPCLKWVSRSLFHKRLVYLQWTRITLNTYQFIFSNTGKFRWQRHVVFWVIWCIYFALTFLVPTYWVPAWNLNGPLPQIEKYGWLISTFRITMNSILMTVVHMALVYGILYFILPRYLSKQKNK